jgi:hypothetical protein
MATISLYQQFSVTIDGKEICGGSRSAPASITAGSGTCINLTHTVATAATWDVWTSGAEEIDDFDFLWVKSDTAGVYLELVVDANAGVGIEQIAIALAADIPFVLARDDAMANYTINFGGGTADVIDTIRVRNDTGGNALLHAVLIT